MSKRICAIRMKVSAYLQPSPDPVDYPASIRLLEDWITQEPPDVDLAIGMRWLTHGRKTRQAILLLHGYTNGPKQFYQLGEAFYQRGFNLLIPRFPGHAYQDRMTGVLANLTRQQLLQTLNRSLHILRGLGDECVVMGLSMGGVLTGWAAQTHPEIKRAVIISPAIGLPLIPFRLTRLIAWIARQLPNVYLWWNPVLKDTPAPPWHAYPRYATRGLAMIVDLGQALLRASAQASPKAGSTVIVSNLNDSSVDNKQVNRLAENWRSVGAPGLKTYDFEAKLQLGHDLIDPDQPDQKVDLVYPVLLDLVAEL